ncbi:MAG: c-type cytochrome [Gemmataceae bacterium]
MPAEPSRVSGVAKVVLFAAPFILFAAATAVGVWAMGKLPTDPAGPYGGYLALYNPAPAPAAPPDGSALYAHYCAQCHGVNGDGNGTTPLSPKARYFAYEKFKFTDTQNPVTKGGGTPTDEALVAILRRGIPGSPMPSFAHLGDDALRAIVAHLRSSFLRPEVVLARIKKAEMDKAKDDWDEKSDWSPAKQAGYLKKAAEELQVGTPLEVAVSADHTPEAVERGRKAFETLGCAKCHGPHGKGDGEQTKDPKFVNENGTRAFPRDLTAGVYKGGGDPADLYRRVFLGIPGTPMPANGVTASKQDLADVVQFVRSLPAAPPAEPSAKMAAK